MLKSPITNMAEDIKRVRKSLKMTQAALAKELGVHPITITNWESGKQNVSDENAMALNNLCQQHRSPHRLRFQPIRCHWNSEEEKKEFSRNCKKLRKKLGWRQADLAQYLNVFQCNVSKWENGKLVAMGAQIPAELNYLCISKGLDIRFPYPKGEEK